jgi:hypothetical protein
MHRLVLLSTAAALLASARAGEVSGQEIPSQPPGVDRVVLLNGNVLDGEVLGMSRGKLEFDTDAMNVVSIDWSDIALVSSHQIFEITDVTGSLYYGDLGFSQDRRRVLVVTLGDEVRSLPFSAVVELRSLEESFWAKTSGFIDVGINLARANKLRSSLLKGQFRYGGRIWEVDLNAESYFQSQLSEGSDPSASSTTQTSRNSVTLEGRRNISGLWAATTSGRTESNEELSLDSRVLLTVGARYNIVRNQELELHAGASAVFNAEQFTGEQRVESGEVKFTLGFDMFDLGDVDVYTLGEGFITRGLERYRLNLDARISWEIFNDFTIGANAVERYDSSPANGAAKRDFQYGLTVGWTWG